MVQRAKITIRGAVQGVGFRPFVFRLAGELGIRGWVLNSSQGVFIEAEADEVFLADFITRLKTDKPKNSFIQSFEHSVLDPVGFQSFEIRQSDDEGAKTALVLPDIATCPDCLNEIFDPKNRRYLYPFTNCTNCGPRYSIITSLPYDRKNTTMGEFVMCENCLEEYENPSDRRFHAEPTACPECGPRLALLDENGNGISEKHKALKHAAELIKNGKIIALKGIGGYQLICDAGNDEAVKLLRQRKKRSEKPFALMFPDIESIKKVCELSLPEESLLNSIESPIVLLKKRKNVNGVSDEAALNNPYLGIMLPYSPLHHILMKELNFPIIATSGNISEEPICTDEHSALEKLKGIADYFLTHNRKINRHVDDSITRIAAGREMIIRRARGYAPLPVKLPGLKPQVLATGAHLKNTIALNKNENVFVSQHIGDLENNESVNAFKKVIDDLKSFYEITPEHVICDLHPDYTSTKYAFGQDTKAIPVQHHFAHILSCMAENEITGKVLGFSWDGTGYGTDGSIWGSECMIVNNGLFQRFAHLRPFLLPGGEKAIQEVWRIGLALLYEMYGHISFKQQHLPYSKMSNAKIIRQMLEKKINSPETTSMGRFFDGVASLAGIKDIASFEAQAAMELEFAADVNVIDIESQETGAYPFSVNQSESDIHIIGWFEIIEGILSDSQNKVSKAVISLKFHNTLAEIIAAIARKSRCEKIILTGGCFQNRLLLEKAVEKLQKEKFKVYWHQRIPTNDGGISLGQIKYSTYIN